MTFTEKAARELRQRIVTRAAALADNPEVALEEELELAQMLGDRQLPASSWRAILDQLPAAPIGTFHSLCVRILRQYAEQAQIQPNFSIFDTNDQKRAMKEAI